MFGNVTYYRTPLLVASVVLSSTLVKV